MTIEKIEDDQLYLPPNITQTINQLVDVVNSLTGGEKECKHKNTGTCLACYNEALEPECKHEISGVCLKCNRDVLGEKEPKSNTLRERIIGLQKKTVISRSDAWHNKYADQILSLVKVHLEKEVGDLQTTWVGEEPATVERDDVLSIIKNL